jgi:tRNA(Ile)-lysidine synthase
MVPAEAVERFRRDLETLTEGPPDKIGVAVSGGPDSLALLLLAAAAYPGRVEAATVDHHLRPEGAAEAAHVAAICDHLGIPHATLSLEWPDPRGNNIQARAREGRYLELLGWALDKSLPYVATAHHVNDQAETVLMRLARGSGVSGLAGTRPRKLLGGHADTGASVELVRPLLGWRREELAGIVTGAALTAVDDPSNSDHRYDRVRVRAFLSGNDWLDPQRLAESASHLFDAEEALAWWLNQVFADRHTHHEDGSVTLDPSDLPRELQRRLLLQGLSFFAGCTDLPGPKVARLLDELRAGRSSMIGDIKVTAGRTWHLDWAPPRRS